MRIRQGSLHCFLSLVKCVDKRVMFGYWSAFIPDTPPIGGPPCLTLLTVALKDPSPKVRQCIECHGVLEVCESSVNNIQIPIST